jgi:hypothetical protein
MDTSTAIQAGTPSPPPTQPALAPRKKVRHPLLRLLDFVASLKVTVVLFAMSLFLVFFGTWAQVDSGIWDVVNKYFRSLFVWIPLKVLSFYSLPKTSSLNDVCVPYPGGWLLGAALLTNLLAAHIVRFKLKWSRAGIIILHAGIILMMLGEFFTGMYAVEGMMTIEEGETVNHVQDNRSIEIAVVDATDPKRTQDDIVALYLPAIRKKGIISTPELPFDLEVKKFMKNSSIEPRKPDDEPQANRGHGIRYNLEERPEVSGADPEQKIDEPAAIVELKAKDGQSLGIYSLQLRIGLILGPDEVKIGDKTYEISLRPKRSYRDFTVTLDKAEERKHPNTPMTKDFSSFVTLNDPANGVENRKFHIWMNNPLRYNGETFFQANMRNDKGTMVTGLQVVRNRAWILPYLSCIVVAIGMLLHFGVNLVGFLKAQARAQS